MSISSHLRMNTLTHRQASSSISWSVRRCLSYLSRSSASNSWHRATMSTQNESLAGSHYPPNSISFLLPDTHSHYEYHKWSMSTQNKSLAGSHYPPNGISFLLPDTHSHYEYHKWFRGSIYSPNSIPSHRLCIISHFHRLHHFCATCVRVRRAAK
jgi:hypothetical protein